MTKSEIVTKLLILFAIVIGYYGFRFVTQAGQGLGVIQNDGYGGSGGILILVSGFILGWAAKRKYDEK